MDALRNWEGVSQGSGKVRESNRSLNVWMRTILDKSEKRKKEKKKREDKDERIKKWWKGKKSRKNRIGLGQFRNLQFHFIK